VDTDRLHRMPLCVRTQPSLIFGFQPLSNRSRSTWVPGTHLEPHDAHVAFPFGSGPRVCPGRSLALLEMQVVLALLYKHRRQARWRGGRRPRGLRVHDASQGSADRCSPPTHLTFYGSPIGLEHETIRRRSAPVPAGGGR
jgi:hypothetical protein